MDEEDDFYLHIKYQGVEYETYDLKNDPSFDFLRIEMPYWQKKYMDFRYIQPKDQPQMCYW